MVPVFGMLKLAVQQALVRQQAARVPEPSGAMDSDAQVADYDHADRSKLALTYRGILWLVERLGQVWDGADALDVCCGPGHFTVALARVFPFQRVVGVDLSEGMLAAARRRAARAGVADRVAFVRADALELERTFQPAGFRLITCNNALHHLPDLAAVERLLGQLERVAHPGGYIVVTDLVRLKTEGLNERYVALLAGDYGERGLEQLRADFLASMQAAWTPEELAGVVPRAGKHVWEHGVTRFLPTMQFLVARPRDVAAGADAEGNNESEATVGAGSARGGVPGATPSAAPPAPAVRRLLTPPDKLFCVSRVDWLFFRLSLAWARRVL